MLDLPAIAAAAGGSAMAVRGAPAAGSGHVILSGRVRDAFDPHRVFLPRQGLAA
jgi:hypothetical protein